jgi:hypothetical protein
MAGDPWNPDEIALISPWEYSPSRAGAARLSVAQGIGKVAQD